MGILPNFITLKGFKMDKKEIMYAIVCVAVFAFIGVLLAWRG
jgi:hypothetical protein